MGILHVNAVHLLNCNSSTSENLQVARLKHSNHVRLSSSKAKGRPPLAGKVTFPAHSMAPTGMQRSRLGGENLQTAAQYARAAGLEGGPSARQITCHHCRS